jgi:prepilin-type N-terminal cleavage/methylation domain-containing protein
MQVNKMPARLRGENRRQSGYTLVEVLCAVAIVAVMASVLFVGFDNGFTVLRTTREDMRATQILMQKTEAVRLLTWPQLSNCPTTFQEYFYPGGAVTTNGGTLYCGTLSTTDAATNIPATAAYRSSVHLVTITVLWTNYINSKPVAHSRQMQTLNAQFGMQTYLW